MKKFTTIIFLLLPLFSMAQENLLGRSQTEIRGIFKNNSGTLLQNNTLYGFKYSDAFNTNSNEQIICGYDKNKVCVEVLKIVNVSLTDSATKVLNNKCVKKDGETFETGVWADAGKTYKVHLYANMGRLILDYIPYDKAYVIH